MKHRLEEYLLNPLDTERPLRYKTYRNEHRANREFTDTTKRMMLEKAGYKCENCSQRLTLRTANFHHILSLSYAFHYFLDFTDSGLKSVHNCKVLCDCCHKKIHLNDSLEFYTKIALELQAKLESDPINPELFFRKTCKRPQKQRRREMQRQYQS